MKKTVFLIASLLASLMVLGQEMIFIHTSDRITKGASLTENDSIFFSNDGLTVYFRLADTLAAYAAEEIDSVTFGPATNLISVFFEGDHVSVINPFAFQGVLVEVSAADVTVYSSNTSQTINYRLSGSTNDGCFKLYSGNAYTLLLNGVSITNPNGPAFNLQSTATAYIQLLNNTINSATDGAVYASAPAGEDQDGPFFSEGNMIFSGTGTLIVNGLGNSKHGLCTDSSLEIQEGTITIASAAKDGIHADAGVMISGGNITVTSTGDGIDGDTGELVISGGQVTTTNNSDDVKGISASGALTISGGTIHVTVAGDMSKGLKSKALLSLNGGDITIHNSGDAVLEASGQGYDPSYCTAVKSDMDIVIDGAHVTIVASGLAGKGISSDASIIMNSGTVNITSTGNGAKYVNPAGVADAYVSTCFSADVDIELTGGTIITSSSGSAGKGISADGSLIIGGPQSNPEIDITTTGTRILVSGSGNSAVYAEAKAIKSDNSVTINNGNVQISSADDGIKSETSIDILGGEITITNSVEGLEAPYITMNNGYLSVKASDDCINATFGSGGETNDGSLLTIANGTVVANTTGGDGLDSNGSILISGGTTIIHGPPSAPEVAIDYNGSFNMNGGMLVASGTNSNMTQAPSNSSLQRSVKVMSGQQLSASTLFHIQDANANDVVTFQPMRNYYSIIFSSAALQNGATYSIYTGGSSTGTVSNGLYSGGVYSGGTFRKSFTVNSIVTSVSF